MLDRVKRAMRITGDAYDLDLQLKIAAALADLRLAGADPSAYEADPLVQVAVITYCMLHSGNVDPDEWDRLRKSYTEQKAQLSTSMAYSLYDKGGVQL